MHQPLSPWRQCSQNGYMLAIVWQQVILHTGLPQALLSNAAPLLNSPSSHCAAQVVLTSAAKREGLSDLESALLLQSELMGLKASPSREAEGIVVEAKLDKGQGPVATVIIKHGTLRVADVVVVGTEWGRVKSLKNGLGLILSSAKPGMPAEIAGLKGVPMAGDELMVLSRCADTHAWRRPVKLMADGCSGCHRSWQ